MVSYLRLFQFGLLVFFASHPLFAQEPNSSCQNMRYEYHNQIDPPPRHVGTVEGLVKDVNGSDVRKACVGVFTDAEHKLLAATEADDHGRFAVAGLGDGTYRLVISADDLCTANVRIILKNGSRRKKQLIAKMWPRGIDACSWIAKS